MNSTTIEALPSVGTPGSFGNRKDKLGKLFVPVVGRTLPTAVALKAWFNENVVNGSVNIADYYSLGGGPISLDFSGGTVLGGAAGTVGPPNMNTVETGGGGLPATPYVPNPASPGPGSTHPFSIPPSPQFTATMKAKEPGHAIANPSVTSAAMKTTLVSAMTKLMGVSPASAKTLISTSPPALPTIQGQILGQALAQP